MPKSLLIWLVAALAGCAGLPRPDPVGEAQRAEGIPGGKAAVRPEPAPRPPPAPREADPRAAESAQLGNLIDHAHGFAAMPAERQRRELAAVAQGFSRERSDFARLKLGLLLSLPDTAIADEARALGLLEPLASGAAVAGPLRRFAGLLHAQVAERLREQQRSAQLREQLEALKDMERSLMERGRRRPR